MAVNFERNNKFQEFLIEKKRIDDIIRKIHEEQMEEIIKQKEKKEMSRFQYEEFKRQKQEILREMKLRNDEENKRIQEIIQKREEEARKLEELKLKQRFEHEDLSKKLGMKILNIEEEERRRRDVMEELLVEEFKAKQEAKYKDELEKQIRKRIDISVSLENYIQEKRRNREAELKEFNRIAKEEQLKFREESEKLEKQSNEDRIKSRIERSNEITSQLETRKLEREKNVRKQIEDWTRDLKDKEKR